MKLNFVLNILSGNFLSPTSVSDWLIFFYGNSILHQNRNENSKKKKFLMKNKQQQQQKKPRMYL